MEQQICNKSIDGVYEWVKENLDRLVEFQSELPFLVFKTFILIRKQNGLQFEELIQLCQSHFDNKIISVSKKRIQTFITSLYVMNN